MKLNRQSLQLLEGALFDHNEGWGGYYELHMRLQRDKAIVKKGDFLDIVEWKSARNMGRARKDVRWGDRHVQLTREAFNHADRGQLKTAIKKLDEIRWVAPRTASAILMFYNPEKFTVMDVFAWNALDEGLRMKPGFGYETAKDYPQYNAVCQGVAKAFGRKLRDTDRALWFMGKYKTWRAK